METEKFSYVPITAFYKKKNIGFTLSGTIVPVCCRYAYLKKKKFRGNLRHLSIFLASAVRNNTILIFNVFMLFNIDFE